MEITRPRPLVGVSLKMYFNLEGTRTWLTRVREMADDLGDCGVDLFVVPDFLTIGMALEVLDGSGVAVAAQDASWEDYGALTGEVSPAMLAELGCRYVEIGHAERRKMFAEDDIVTARKATAAARNGLVPLVCVGETVWTDSVDAARETVEQVEMALEDVPSEAEVLVAYEPIWAIGQHEPASAEHVVVVTTKIRESLARRTGTSRVIYGGSAGPGLYGRVSEGVDGLFLGRFAHDVANFRAVVDEVIAGL